MPRSLYLLAVAVFAMGTSEFVLAGLLSDIATEFGVSVGTAGTLTSAFAVGMVVGAPLAAAVSRRWPPRTALLCFLAVFTTAHVFGALTTSFSLLIVTRVIAALANAGFLAVALSASTMLVAADRTGRALAVLLSGTTVATIAGVPVGALLGAELSWRATFWAIALLCLVAAVGVATTIPVRTVAQDRHAEAGPSLRSEVRELARCRLAMMMVLGALINAGTFSTFTFLAPLVTDTAGLGEVWVSLTLMLFGLGSFIGVSVAGRLSDRHAGGVLAIGGPLLFCGWLTMAVLAAQPLALLLLVFIQGALSFAVGSTMIARVLHEAAAAPTMGGAYATAALNVGAAAGPTFAALGVTSGAHAVGPVWVSSVLVASALLIALAGLALTAFRRRSRAVGETARLQRQEPVE